MKDVHWLEESDITPPPGGKAVQKSTGAEPQRPARQPREIRLLVVEDNPADLHILQIALWGVTGASFDVVSVDTLSQGLEQIARGHFDLVLLDLGLPDSQGLDSFLPFREYARTTPIIVLTGNADESAAIRAIQEGAQDYLLKGTDAMTLVRAMRYAMGRQRMRRRVVRALETAQASEANLRKIIDQNLDGIVVADSRGKVLHANSAAAKMFGYQSDEMRGQPLGLPIKVGAIPQVDLVNLAGKVIPTEMRVTEIDWSGKPAYLTQLRDLTERKALEANRLQLQLAREVQRSLLPTAAPQLAGFDIAGTSISADETGGDYFDYLPMPNNRLGMVIGDASGHGFAPAILISEAAAYLRAYAPLKEDLGEVLTLVNGQLAPRCPEDHFVTMILTNINPQDLTLTYASAGHPAAILFDQTGAVKHELESLDTPIGLLPGTVYRCGPTVTLDRGDVLVLLSDGVTDAMSPNGTMFGTQGVVDLVRAHLARPAQEIISILSRTVRDHCAPLSPRDDLTAVVVRVDKKSSDTGTRGASAL